MSIYCRLYSRPRGICRTCCFLAGAYKQARTCHFVCPDSEQEMVTQLIFFALGVFMLAMPNSLIAESYALQKTTAKPKAAAPKSSTAKAPAKPLATAAKKPAPTSAKAILFAVSQRDSTATLD